VVRSKLEATWTDYDKGAPEHSIHCEVIMYGRADPHFCLGGLRAAQIAFCGMAPRSLLMAAGRRHCCCAAAVPGIANQFAGSNTSIPK
jgi:hypothetical protein